MKKFLLLLTSVLSIHAYAQIPTAGLIAGYSFSGNANDESGNGNNGTVYGATLTAGATGIPNSAYSFDGISNYIFVPYNPAFNTSTVTMCAVVKVQGFYSGTCQGNVILYRGNDNSPGHFSLLMSDNPHDLSCSAFDSLHTSFYAKIGTYNTAPDYPDYVVTNTWYCIAGTYDHDSIKVYVDGVKKYSAAFAGGVGSSTSGISIGNNQFWTSLFPYWFKGIIDDIRIYNRVLTESEIQGYCSAVENNLSLTTTNTNPPCNGGCNGTAIASPANGIPPYTYLWSPTNASTQTVSALCAGNYWVTVTDSVGNTATAAVTINQPTPLTIAVNAVDASCSTCNDGYAWAAGGGGTPPYNYEWGTVPIQSTDTAYNLAPGSYYVCVDDSFACKTCSTIVVSYTVGINSLSGSTGFSIHPNPSNGNITIAFHNTLKNRTIEIFNSLGQEIYSRKISASIKEEINLNAAAGIYFVKVTDGEKVFAKKLVIQ